jgi:hypothetical protein
MGLIGLRGMDVLLIDPSGFCAEGRDLPGKASKNV